MRNGKERAVTIGKRARQRAALVAAVIALGGCSTLDAINPIGWFRDAKNDPAPDAANSANLEAGSQQPYPNLASVPPTPTRGLTKAEREALAQGLIADRDNARYTDQQQRAGNADAVLRQTASTNQPPLQPIDLNDVPQQGPTPSPVLPRPAPRPVAPVPPAPAPVAAAPRPTSVAPVAAPGSSHLSVGGGFPVAASRESALKAPAPREEPQPETPVEPPPAPTLAPVPSPAPVAPLVQTPPAPDSKAAAVDGVPVPPASPVRAEPTPPPPQLAAAPSVEPPAATPVPDKRKTSISAAQIRFAQGSNALPADAGAQMQAVVANARAHDGIVRVIGHASVAAGTADDAGQKLAAYQSALARAAAVKQALIAAGYDGAKIQTEAAPAQAGALDRADIMIEY